MLAHAPAQQRLWLPRLGSRVAHRPERAPRIEVCWCLTPPPRLVWLVVEAPDGRGRLEWRVRLLPEDAREGA